MVEYELCIAVEHRGHPCGICHWSFMICIVATGALDVRSMRYVRYVVRTMSRSGCIAVLDP